MPNRPSSTRSAGLASCGAARRGLVLIGLCASLACHGSARPAAPPAPKPDATTTSSVAASDSSTAAARADSAMAAGPDLATTAVTLFGDSIMPPLPAIAEASDSDAGHPTAPTWDIDVHSYETHARVAYYISRFQGEAHDRFTIWLQRSGRYEPMIRAKLRACHLPEDMTYLALIESGYDPHAYSSAAAVGMWQFMTSTARGTGLRVDWWVDERRDPVRSTDAACKFLGWLNEQFGSLYLAAAAYNGGPGRVSRGLTRYADAMIGTEPDAQFFALAEHDALRAETKDYVPKLIAAALVAKQPARYGFEVQYQPPLQYDTVRVPPSTPLAAVATAAGSTASEEMELNPELLRGVTPPRDSFVVRVPFGKGDAFGSAFDSLPAATRSAYTRLVTKKGTTMQTVANRAGINSKQLGWYNRDLSRSKSGRIAVGQVVLIPTSAVVSAARDVPDPGIERYGSSRGRTLTHVVKRGESLGTIAAHYHTSTASLKRLNGLRKTIIVPGQVIVVRQVATGRRHRKVVAAK